MKKAFIFRMGAYGDMIHLSYLPRLLKEKGFDYVEFETGGKGCAVFFENPYINKLIMAQGDDPHLHPMLQKRALRNDLLKKRLSTIACDFDEVFDLSGTLEDSITASEWNINHYVPLWAREERPQKVFEEDRTQLCYYDRILEVCGFPEEKGKWQGEMYFNEEEVKIVEKYISKYKDKFVFLFNMSGSGRHKQFIQGKEIAKRILDKYDDALIITSANIHHKDKTLKELDDKRVRTIIGHQGFRQAALLAKYVDCVIGPESGLTIAGSMWGTPTIQMMSTVSIQAHCKYAKNDYSIQSPAYCSPCYRGCYQYIGCPTKDKYPLCAYFDVEEILKRVDKIYDRFRKP